GAAGDQIGEAVSERELWDSIFENLPRNVGSKVADDVQLRVDARRKERPETAWRQDVARKPRGRRFHAPPAARSAGHRERDQLLNVVLDIRDPALQKSAADVDE